LRRHPLPKRDEVAEVPANLAHERDGLLVGEAGGVHGADVIAGNVLVNGRWRGFVAAQTGVGR
jgi:hypothetical protein